MAFKGIVRIKCIDLANWAAMHNKLTDIPDGIRVATEGMETLTLHVEQSDTCDGLCANLEKALEFAIERFGEQNDDMCMMLKMLENDMEDRIIDQSYSIQLKYPNAPYIDVVIKDTENPKE